MRLPAIRKVPFVVATLVLVGAGLFYLVVYTRQRAYVEARNVRLLRVAEETLLGYQGGGRGVDRAFERVGGDLVIKTQRHGAGIEWTDVQANQVVALPELLAGIPVRADAFDVLMLVDDTGEVVASAGDGTLARLLDKLGNEGRTDLAPDALWRGAHKSEVRFFGEAHQLFCRPVPLAHTAAGQGRKGFIVCGAVREQRLVGQAMDISPPMVALLLAALALTFLSPPFFRLALIGKSERFRFGDAYALALCTFVGLLILTVVTLDWALVQRLNGRADDRLQALAEQVRTNVEAELGAFRAQVVELDVRRARTEGKTRPAPGDGILCTDLYGLFGTVDGGQGCPRFDLASLRYPNIDTITWVGEGGEQLIKWSGLTSPLLRFDVSSREYFKAARDGRLWHLEGAAAADGFLVEVLGAWSSGQQRAALALPARNAAPAAGEPPAVVAATARLFATSDAVLPPDAGFAVVNAQGDVLFHSDARQALAHNLFAETDESFELRAAVASRVADHTSGRYWGQRHRFYVAPLPWNDWSVVAFRDEGLLRAFNVEVLEDAVALALVYAILTFVIPSLLLLRVLRRRTEWLWPDGEHAVTQRVALSLSLLSVTALAGRALARAPSDAAIAIAFVIPLAVLVALVIAFTLGRARVPMPAVAVACGAASLALLVWPPGPAWFALVLQSTFVAAAWTALVALGRQSERGLRLVERWTARPNAYVFPHVVVALLFWAGCALLPGVAFMKAAYDAEARGLARYEQNVLLRGLQARARRLETFYGRALRSARSAEVRPSRDQAARDVYTTGLFDTGLVPAPGAPPGPGPRSAFTAWLDELLAHKPLLTGAAAPLRHLGTVGDLPGESTRGDGSASRLVRSGPGVPGTGRLHVASVIPSFWTMQGGVGPLALFLAVAALLVAWVRWSARRIFLAELAPEAARSLADVKLLPRNAICVIPSTVDGDRAAAGRWCERVPLRDIPAPDEADRRQRPIVVDGLEVGRLTVEERARALSALEHLARGRRRCHVFTSVPPAVSFLAPGPVADGGPDWLPGERDRWIRLVGRFELVAVRDRRRLPRTASPQRIAGMVRRLLGVPAGEEPDPDVARALAREIAGSPTTMRVLARMRVGALAGLPADEVPARVAQAAWSEYWALWSGCSADEKLVLVQLAEEAFINPRQAAVVRRLMAKGLVVREGLPQPKNDSFAVFVKSVRDREEIERWEKTSGAFGWADMKLPLVSVALACAFLLFKAHQDLLDSTVVFVSALGAWGVPGVAKLATAFKTWADAGGAVKGAQV